MGNCLSAPPGARDEPSQPPQHPNRLLGTEEEGSGVVHVAATARAGGHAAAGSKGGAPRSTTQTSTVTAAPLSPPPQLTCAAGSAVSSTHNQHGQTPDVLSPLQVLAVCAEVVQEDGGDASALQAAGITPLLLASLCLIESGGCSRARQHREHVGETAHGLCQMLLPTARWLSASQGFDRHGSSPVTLHDLHRPKTCTYFAAAYLQVLAHYGGGSSSPRSEGFVVRAYHTGPKGVETAAARSYLEKYLKAKHCLTEVARAAAVTVAAAALAAQLRLPAGPEAEAAGEQLPDVQTASKTALPTVSSSSRSHKGNDSTDCRDQDRHSADSSTSGASSSRQVVVVRRAAADLVATLCSSWGDSSNHAAGGHAARTAAGGGILAHVLPSRWSSSRQQQQQGQQHTRHSSAAAADSAAALVSVDAADIHAAWQRLLCISPALAEAALSRAAAAAALAPLPTEGETGSSDAVCPAESTAAAAAAAPCVMHVVGHGETVQSIAAVCSLSVTDLLAANPGVCDASALHHNDCIALPLAACMPRLHVVQAGDTPQSIACAHGVTVGRVLAKNPELLTEPTRVQPGWVVALPGLHGDSSQLALPADWLAQTSLCSSTDLLQQPAAAPGPLRASGCSADSLRRRAEGLQPAKFGSGTFMFTACS